MVFSNKKRFIAGAICTQCKKPDVIVVFNDDEDDWQLCVECGFRQTFKETLIENDEQPIIIKDSNPQ